MAQLSMKDAREFMNALNSLLFWMQMDVIHMSAKTGAG